MSLWRISQNRPPNVNAKTRTQLLGAHRLGQEMPPFAVFHLYHPEVTIRLEALADQLIDAGLEEMKREEDEVVLYTSFTDFGAMQKALEDRGIETSSAGLEYIPNQIKKISDTDVEQVIKLIDRLEEDDDVLNVFHSMDMSE